MPIEFEAPKRIAQMQFMLKTVADEMMRPRSRYFDEHEHEIPWDYIEFMHTAMKAAGGASLAPRQPSPPSSPERGQVRRNRKTPTDWISDDRGADRNAMLGDVGMYHCLAGGGLGGGRFAAGTREQRKNSWRGFQ
jgi:acyl-CoA dehydrogenase